MSIFHHAAEFSRTAILLASLIGAFILSMFVASNEIASSAYLSQVRVLSYVSIACECGIGAIGFSSSALRHVISRVSNLFRLTVGRSQPWLHLMPGLQIKVIQDVGLLSIGGCSLVLFFQAISQRCSIKDKVLGHQMA